MIIGEKKRGKKREREKKRKKKRRERGYNSERAGRGK